MRNKPRVQFILKKRETYWGKEEPNQKVSLSSGLFNSARFVVDALNRSGMVDAEIIHVDDNNDIDREVSRFKPSLVIIEAYWVVPEKFAVLAKLHPKVKWLIRNHSEVPFAAQEGVIMDWTIRYLHYKNVYVSCNSHRAYHDMLHVLTSAHPELEASRVVYLPNIYPSTGHQVTPPKREDGYLDIACFGAIRPLKNHLLQAMAAVVFADKLGKKLRFHINGNRVEGAGSQEILKNLRAMFHHLPNHQLVEHDWHPHAEFLSLLRTMDMGMQVSFSETFNIVAADMVHVGLPVVSTKEVLWSPWWMHTDPTDLRKIVSRMSLLWALRKTTLVQGLSHLSLNRYSFDSLDQWLEAIEDLA